MRVLYLINSSQIGGGNRSLQNIWEGIRDYGMNVEPIAVCPGAGPMVALCRDVGVPVTVRPYHQPSWRQPYETLRGYYDWRFLLEHLKPKLIHANDFSTARSVSLAAKNLGLPLVCHIRFHADVQYLRWVFRGLPKPDAFIYNSEATRQLCGPTLAQACPRASQVVVHNCVSFKRFNPAVPNGQAPRSLRVGIVANLIPIKGHMDFLEMAHLLIERGITTEYWLIGDDIHQSGYRRQLEQRHAELGLGEAVKFLGHRLDVPNLLRQLDVVVCASHVEPFGLCSIEAMACALPVVGTKVGGIPEVIADGVTGYLVAPQAPHELADKVALLLGDAALRKRMGQAGYKRAQCLFNCEMHVNKIVSVYHKLLS